MNHVIIAGAGHAGIQLADSLRTEGYSDRITLVDAETGLPYQRPPLSKDFLAADGTPELVPLKARKFFADKDIELVEANPIVSVDRHERAVTLANGDRLPYSALVFATGARTRRLVAPGADLGGVHHLRSADDATRLRSELAAARTVVVVGAGFIGLEFAAAAVDRGLDVTVVELGPRAMGRAVSAQISEYFQRLHAARGVRFVFDQTVSAFEGDAERVRAVVGGDGRRYPADLVVVGIGVEPNETAATDAGLRTDNGIVVNEYLRTDDDAIWAIGDCARFPCRHAGAPIRRESIQNAVDQARTLAATLTGRPTEYHHSPWFWSYQGKTKLQIAGVARGDGPITVVGDPGEGKFSVLRFDETRLVCVESVNHPAAHMAARSILSTASPISQEELAIVAFDLKLAARLSRTA
ncbi:NAD(P)/FAD-dependent oxidoreductase [Nocardia fluminea]|uniref:NAD(P)/FAD-dependent oxidoreductase n=1 Tax=Nocardia fluminea TaxID=134984 RepID=UPI00367034BC